MSVALLPPVGRQFRGVLLKRTTQGSNVFTHDTETIAPWEVAVIDTDGFWLAGAPTLITIPAGITRVRLTSAITFNNLCGRVKTRIEKVTGSTANFCHEASEHFDINGGEWSNRHAGTTSVAYDLAVSYADQYRVIGMQSNSAAAARAFNADFTRSFLMLEVVQ